MDPLKLPHGCVLFEQGGVWILRCNEGIAFGNYVTGDTSCPRQTVIAATAGSKALSESEARHVARRYLLRQMLPATRTTQSQMTVLEFVRTRFVPEFINTKDLARRTHYQSLLKHILPPGEVDRMFHAEPQKANPSQSVSDWPYLGLMRLRDVRPDHVQRLIVAASGRGYSPQTVRHIRSVVSAIFSYAMQELIFTGANPARSTKLPESVCSSVPALTLAQTEEVLRVMRYPEKEMTLIALLTDMNVSEICGLQWKNVNLTGAWSNAVVDPIPPITIDVNKRWYRGELTSVKDARRRRIQIPEALLSMFLLLSGRDKFTGPEDFVLASRSGAAINVTNITARRLNSIGKQLGITGLKWAVFRRAQSSMKHVYGPHFQYQIAAVLAPNGNPGTNR